MRAIQMKYRSCKFKTVSLQWVYPVFVHVLNNNLPRKGGILVLVAELMC
jgi:hypothetical protein